MRAATHCVVQIPDPVHEPQDEYWSGDPRWHHPELIGQWNWGCWSEAGRCYYDSTAGGGPFPTEAEARRAYQRHARESHERAEAAKADFVCKACHGTGRHPLPVDMQ